MSDLTRLEAAAAGLESLPEDSETADYIGRLDKIIRTLQGHRKTIMDELPGPVSGAGVSDRRRPLQRAQLQHPAVEERLRRGRLPA